MIHLEMTSGTCCRILRHLLACGYTLMRQSPELPQNFTQFDMRWTLALPRAPFLMKLKRTPPSDRRESWKGGSVDSDMSGKEVARALGRLSRGGMHEFLNNVLLDIVEASWVMCPTWFPHLH